MKGGKMTNSLNPKECPMCKTKNTGINGDFFFADGEWICLGCGKSFVEDRGSLQEVE